MIEYDKEIKLLVNVVEGNLDIEEFSNHLSEPKFKELLESQINPKYPATTNFYNKLIGDISKVGDKLNIQATLERFLYIIEVPYSRTDKYSKIYDLILETQPSYLDLPEEYFTELLETNKELSKTKLKKLIKDKIKVEFQFLKKPPNWIQSPEWIIEPEGPLLFVGELPFNLPGSHDEGKAYLFFSTINGFETVVQQY